MRLGAKRRGALLSASILAGVTMFIVACGGGGTAAPSTPPPSSPSSSGASVAAGQSLYTSLGCVTCHSLDGSAGTGPTWKGLAGSKVKLTNGQTVVANATYLLNSIETPDKQIVAGFKPGVMSAVIAPHSVSLADARALIAFIQSVR